MDPSLSQRKLVAELAVAVSQFMRDELRGDTDEHGFIFHSFQGPFDENGCTLWELGVAWAASGLGGPGLKFERSGGEQAAPGPSAFKFMPPAETRAIVMALQGIAPELIFRLLETYLRSVGEYTWRQAQLYVGREAFLPAPLFRPQIDALLDSGYLAHSGAMVTWTDSIGPAMRSAGLWEADLKPPAPPKIHLPTEARAAIMSLLASGNRITATAVVRDVACVTVGEAMAFVASLEKSIPSK